MEYEQAATIRDQLNAIERVWLKGKRLLVTLKKIRHHRDGPRQRRSLCTSILRS